MRVLRSSFYGPDLEAMTIVVRDEDLTVPLEEAQRDTIGGPMPGGFVYSTIIEMDECDIPEATLKAMQRVDTMRETNMAMLYHYDAAMLTRVSDTGVVTATRPAPLSADDIELVLKQIVNHPNYSHQTVTAIANNGKLIKMRHGEIEREQ